MSRVETMTILVEVVAMHTISRHSSGLVIVISAEVRKLRSRRLGSSSRHNLQVD